MYLPVFIPPIRTQGDEPGGYAARRRCRFRVARATAAKVGLPDFWADVPLGHGVDMSRFQPDVVPTLCLV